MNLTRKALAYYSSGVIVAIATAGITRRSVWLSVADQWTQQTSRRTSP